MNTNWHKKYLGDLIDIRGGLSYKTSEIGSGEKKLLGMGCVSFDKRFLESGCRKFCGEGKPHHLVTPGDLVIATRQQSDNLPILGFPAQIPNKLSKEEIYVGTNLYKVENNSEYSNSFLYWLMRGNLYRQHVKANTSGSTVRMITKNVILNFQFNCPSIQESIKIAECLDFIEDKIEQNKNTNETLEEIAKALFKSWFIDFDPVKAKAEGRSTGLSDEINNLFPDSFVDSDLGEIPYRWSTQEVGSICECVGGGTPSTKEPLFWENGNNFWATPKDLSDLEKPFLFETSKKITDLGIQKISSRVLPIGTVLISSRAPVGYVALAEVPLSINQGFIAIKPSEILSKEYLLNWAQANVEKFKNRASGTTFAEISKQSFRPIKILLPDETVMGAFSDLTKIIYKRIISSMKEIKNLVDIRNILLPKLISGELRIPDAEKIIEEAGI